LFTSLRFEDISKFRYHFPELVDEKLKATINDERILPFEIIHNEFVETSSNNVQLYFFQGNGNEFDIIINLLEGFNFYVKRHPTLNFEQVQNNITELDFIPWEFFMEINHINNSFLITYYSTVMYTHLVFFKNFNNKTVLLNDLDSSNELPADESRFLNKLAEKFSERIVILNNIDELKEFISFNLARL
jgi:hypothetical protein